MVFLAIKLEFGDRHGAAITDHQLGTVAQAQRRFEEAEGHYRQALTTFLELDDRHSVAITHSQLGILLTARGREAEATEHSLRALAIRLSMYQLWSQIDLSWLKRQRRLRGSEQFDELAKAHVSPDAAEELSNQLDAAPEPDDEYVD
jgi:hypothetical protein